MADLREAFLKAANEKSGSNLAGQIRRSVQSARAEDSQDRRFVSLGRKFQSLGNAAYQLSVRSLSYRGESRPDVLRGQWKVLEGEFLQSPETRRVQMLEAFADGLRLTKNNLDSRYQDLFDTARLLIGRDLVSEAKVTGIDIRARIFLNALDAYGAFQAFPFLRQVLEKELRAASTDAVGLGAAIKTAAIFMKKA